MNNSATGTPRVLEDITRSLGRLESGQEGLERAVTRLGDLQAIANGRLSKHDAWIAAHDGTLKNLEEAEERAAKRLDRRMKLIGVIGGAITVLTNLGPIGQFLKALLKGLF